MTPDELQALVVAGVAGPLVDALASLDEGARRKLSKRAYELFQAANDFGRKIDGPVLIAGAGNPVRHNAELAVLACCDGTKARRLQLFMPNAAEILAILLARKPAWIDGWIKQRLEKRWVPGSWWPVVRGLVRAGIAGKPAPATYINLMVNGLGWRNYSKGAQHVPLSTLLLEDEGLLETEIWQLFEIEHIGFARDWVAALPNRPENHETWTAALIRLAKVGRVDRARLIDAALNGMASGLRPAAIGGIVNFAEALAISTEELATRQALLCQLLANQTGTAVSFALQALHRLERSQQLDRDRLLEMIDPVLLFPKKSQANAALALLKTVAKNDAVRRPRCLLAAARALSNVSDDVQRRATELIEAYPAVSAALRESVDAQIESVAPTIRDRLSALSALSEGDARSEVHGSADLGGIESRVSRLPANVIARWGIKHAIDRWRAAKGAEAWPRIEAEEVDYQPIAPIASPDELLEAIALAIESVSGADDIERLIDGVARFADRRPDSKVADTIFKRLTTATSMKGLASSLGVPHQLVWLVARWFGAEMTPRNSFHEPESWWTARFEPHLTALREGRAWQPLSTPTYAGGWIDPRVWVTRLRAADHISDSDAIQSLLRLAPFGRVAARESLGSMAGAWGRLAEYALGGECRVGMTDVFRAPLWVAAGRARQPAGDLKELRMLLGVANVPDALRESRFSLAQKPGKPEGYRPRHSQSTFLPLDASFDADVGAKMDDIPQCLFYPRKSAQRFSLEWLGAWVIEWKSQIWPANPRGFLYWGIDRMLRRFAAGSSAYEPNYVYVDALRPQQRSLGDVESMALAIACMSGEQEVRRSAVEVLIRAGIEGRLDAGLFAATLDELHAKGWFSISRLAATLAVAARESPQVARVVVDALVAFLARQEILPKGAHDVLEVLYHQSHRLGIAAPEAFKKMLIEQNAGSKTGRLAKDLLDLRESASRAATAGLEAVNRLLERAEAQAAITIRTS